MKTAPKVLHRWT